MKSFVALSLLVVALSCSPAYAGTRVLRDADTATKEKDPAAADGPLSDENFRKTLQKAVGKLRQHGSETLKADLDSLETALNSGALDETIAKVKKDLEGSRFDFRKLLTSFREQAAAGDFGELVTRISAESSGLLDKLQKHAADRVKALADAAHDTAQAV